MTSAVVFFLLAQVEPSGLGTQPGGLDGGQPIESAVLRCKQCHDRSVADEGDPLYLPYDGWASTMMANSVRDPLFQAALSVANQDVAGVGGWCLRCHAPQSYVRGHDVPPDGGGFDAIDTEGVTCDVCHRSVAAPDSGSPLIGNAQLYLDRANVKYGPYENVTSPAHTGTDGGITSNSELCGQCHQVMNPLVAWRDPVDGGVLGPAFPLDTTFDEWKQSKYASSASPQSCQDCHMPRAVRDDGGTSDFYVAKFGMPREAPRRHVFVGGNAWGLDAVVANDPRPDAGLAEQFAETRRLAIASLQRAAQLDVTVPATTAPGASLSVSVRVTNLTGHKLPTGYADGRRMVLQMLLDGQVHTGGFDGGELLDDGWLRTYEVKHGQLGVGPEDHLALHDTIFSDTRIPPAGFAPPNGSPTVPVPVSLYSNGDGTYANFDDVTWDVDVPTTLADGASFDVTVRLLYQPTTPEHVDFLRRENTTTDRGTNLVSIFHANSDAAPIEMARVEKHVPVVVAGAGGGSAQGTGGGSGGAGGGGATVGPPAKSCGCGTVGWPSLLALLLVALRRRRQY